MPWRSNGVMADRIPRVGRGYTEARDHSQACKIVFRSYGISNAHVLALPLSGIDSDRVLTGAQIRAGRALLGWSAATLAERAGVSYPTVQRAETADGVPRMKAPNLYAIQRALEAGGVVLLDPGEQRDGGPGVRLR